MTDVDDELARLLHGAVATLEPPRALDAAAILARGRRLRRRRTAAQLGSALAVAGLAAGVAVAVAVPGFGGTGGTDGATRIPAASAPGAASGGASTSAAVTPPGPPLTRQSILQTFRSLLPDPAVTVSMRHGSEEPDDGPGYVGVTTTYDDGQGKVQIAVSVSYPPSGGGLGSACQISACTQTKDGSRLAVYQGSDRPGQPDLEPKNWSVSLERPDGTTIEVTEWNSMTEKTPSSVTRERPPLTIGQLTAIVSSPTWAELVPPPASVASEVGASH